MGQTKELKAYVGQELEGNLLYSLIYGGMPSKEAFTLIFETTIPFLSNAYPLYFASNSKFIGIEQTQKLYEVKDISPQSITLEERMTDIWPPKELSQ